jgi:hypothetical protein
MEIYQKGPKVNRTRRSNTLHGPNIKGKGPSPKESRRHTHKDEAQAHPAACQTKAVMDGHTLGRGRTPGPAAIAHLQQGGHINAQEGGLGMISPEYSPKLTYSSYKRKGGATAHNTQVNKRRRATFLP